LLAGLLVERDAASVDCADEYLAAANRDAAAVRREDDLAGEWIELRLIPPDVLARLCVDRGYPIAGRDRIDYAVDDDRRLLDAARNVAALSDPRDLQLVDIGLVDLF